MTLNGFEEQKNICLVILLWILNVSHRRWAQIEREREFYTCNFVWNLHMKNIIKQIFKRVTEIQ